MLTEQKDTVFEKPHFSKNSKFYSWLGLGFLWIVVLSLFIYTTPYENDLRWTKAFGEAGFYNDVLRGISSYFIEDGYYSLASLSMVMIVLLLESLAVYLKTYHPQKQWVPFFVRNRRYFEFLAPLIWTIVMAVILYQRVLADQGYGFGFPYEAMLGLEYSIPAFILIFLVNNAISWGLSAFVVFHLSKQPNFLAQGYWIKVIFYFLFVALTYAVILTFKAGFARPLYSNLYWGDELEWLKETNFDRWEHFMKQNEHYSFGWRFIEPDLKLYDPLNHPEYINTSWRNAPLMDWPWYQPSQFGWFYRQGPTYPGIHNKSFTAFPSGHMNTTMGIIIAVGLLFYPQQKTKSLKISKLVANTLSISYCLTIFISLCLTWEHWMSDMFFTLVSAGVLIFPAYWLARLIYPQFLKKFELHQHLEPNLQKTSY